MYRDFSDEEQKPSFEQTLEHALDQGFEQALDQAPEIEKSWRQTSHHSWQQSMAVSIANEPILLSTGKEPTLGLLFYSQPVKAKIASWSSSMIPMVIEEENPAEFSIAPYEPLEINHQRTIDNHYLSQSIDEIDLKMKFEFTKTLTDFEKALNLKSKSELAKEKTSSILRKRPRLITAALQHAANDAEQPDLDSHRKIDVKV